MATNDICMSWNMVNMVLTVQYCTVSEKPLCILHVNMVLDVQCYIMSEIIAPGGLMFTVSQI